jgi:Escherichia/Staphylococcus phage prohead protease
MVVAMAEAWESRVTAGRVELRDSPRGGRMFVGYAFRYGVESENLGGFVERVRPGAATKTVAEQDLRALFNHAPDNLLGRMGAGTLRMADDTTGMGYQIDQPDTSLGRDLGVLVARGDVYGSSFTFKAVGARGQAWSRTERGFPLREIVQMRMRDIGPVTFPAYPAGASEVALRSLAEMRSLPFEEVIAAAADERLGELLGDPDEPAPPPATLVKVKRYW